MPAFAFCDAWPDAILESMSMDVIGDEMIAHTRGTHHDFGTSWFLAAQSQQKEYFQVDSRISSCLSGGQSTVDSEGHYRF